MKIKLIPYDCPPEYYPKRAHPNDAGADVYALHGGLLYPGETTAIDLGFGIETPPGFAAFIFPRSSLAKAGVDAKLPPVDPGYTGPIHALLYNGGKQIYYYKQGERIGQLVILATATPDFQPDYAETRGDGAFGSTGA